jgi:putative membrane protein
MLATLIATHHYGHDGPGWGFPWFLLFWLVLLTVGFVVWRMTAGRRSAVHEATSALANRYARGEIDEAEYRQRLDVLKEKSR